jgi:malate/lactate dehydrogenase
MSKGEGDAGFHQVLATTQERVAEILESTDRAAAEIVEAAKAEAERVVAEAHAQATEAVNAKMERISSLVEDVLARAGTLDSEFEQLRGLVRQSAEELAKELGIDRVESPQGGAPSEREDAQAPGKAFERAEAELAEMIESVEAQVARLDDADDRAEAVKLLAIQMIATGHSAERASERLKTEFNVEDPEAVLASIGAPVNSD